jgi:hypothetical protein
MVVFIVNLAKILQGWRSIGSDWRPMQEPLRVRSVAVSRSFDATLPASLPETAAGHEIDSAGNGWPMESVGINWLRSAG